MCVDGQRADHEALGDLRVGQTLGSQSQHFDLAFRQADRVQMDGSRLPRRWAEHPWPGAPRKKEATQETRRAAVRRAAMQASRECPEPERMRRPPRPHRRSSPAPVPGIPGRVPDRKGARLFPSWSPHGEGAPAPPGLDLPQGAGSRAPQQGLHEIPRHGALRPTARGVTGRRGFARILGQRVALPATGTQKTTA